MSIWLEYHSRFDVFLSLLILTLKSVTFEFEWVCLLNCMIASCGDTFGSWWDRAKCPAIRASFNVIANSVFLSANQFQAFFVRLKILASFFPIGIWTRDLIYDKRQFKHLLYPDVELQCVCLLNRMFRGRHTWVLMGRGKNSCDSRIIFTFVFVNEIQFTGRYF